MGYPKSGMKMERKSINSKVSVGLYFVKRKLKNFYICKLRQSVTNQQWHFAK